MLHTMNQEYETLKYHRKKGPQVFTKKLVCLAVWVRKYMQ